MVPWNQGFLWQVSHNGMEYVVSKALIYGRQKANSETGSETT